MPWRATPSHRRRNVAYVKYEDIPKRREPLGGRDHIQHIETALQRVVPDPGQITVGTPDGTRALSSLESRAAMAGGPPATTATSGMAATANTALAAPRPKKTMGAPVAATRRGRGRAAP